MNWQPISEALYDTDIVLLWRKDERGDAGPEIAYWNWRLDCWVTPDEQREIGKNWPTHFAKIIGPDA